MLGILPFPRWTGRDGNALKPDQKIHEWHEDGRHTLLDYSICHPCASSYVQPASRKPLATAERIEGEKNGDYLEPSRGEGYHFSPVVLETYGAFGQGAQWLLDRACDIMGNELPEGTPQTWTATSFRAYWAQRLSIALQRGNAKAIRIRSIRDMRVDGNIGVDPPPHPH